MKRVAFAFLITLLAAVSVVYASGDSWFGVAFKIEADGLFNATVHSIEVEKVFPASPAAQAGLRPGDVVLGIEGLTVAGASADELKKAMNKPVGATLRLKIKRGSSEPHEFTLIAARKP
ncbi:MAG TPA: PDZ domain-containing protein [Chthoniobacterales bacterium]|jgi:C-terminal processing protease CtpA/Prc